MKNNVNRKNINVDKRNIIPLWKFKQEDDAILKLALYKGAIPFDITGQTIVLGAKRPNNTVIEQTNGFTISGNEIDIELKNNILAANGLVELDLQITDVNGKLTTASFFITVAKKVLGENNLNASNDISAINQLVADLQAKTEEVNNAISTIEPKANQLMNDIQTDYNSLQKIIIDENQAANLQGQITDLGSQLDTMAIDVSTQDDLIKAINKVSNGGSIILNNNIDISTQIIIDKNITFDGRGYKLTCISNGLHDWFKITSEIGNVKNTIFDDNNKGRVILTCLETRKLIISNCEFTGYSKEYGYYRTDGLARLDGNFVDVIIEKCNFYDSGYNVGIGTEELNRCISFNSTTGVNGTVRDCTFKNVNQARKRAASRDRQKQMIEGEKVRAEAKRRQKSKRKK